MIEIVSATRLSEKEFWDKSALGISLRRFAKDSQMIARIAFENRRGLSEVFNEGIDAPECAEILVFIHDDVWIDDDAFEDKLIEGLKSFDIIGVAGNRRRVKHQPAWNLIDEKLTWDGNENLSGSMAHGKYPYGVVRLYGDAPAKCELIDGVLLAAHKAKLKDIGLRFDPRFDFHFYDLDFCRSAKAREALLGTWPISLTHQSIGVAVGSTQWKENYRLYLDKWEDTISRATIQGIAGGSEYATASRHTTSVFQRFKNMVPGFQGADHVRAIETPSNLLLPQGDFLVECAHYKKCGNEVLAKGDLDNAAECYGHAVAVNPKDAEAFLNLGFVLNELSHFHEAERCLKQAIQINSESVDAHYLLGLVALARGKFNEAIEQFNKVLDLNPGFEIVYGDLGNAYLQNKQIELAKNILLKGIDLFPNQIDYGFYMGNIYSHEREYENAISWFQKVLSIQPDYVEARSNLGLALQAQEKLDDAIEQYQIALLAMPDYAELHNNLGYGLQLQGKLDQAVESYYRAIELKSDIDIAHLNLLSVLQSQGKLSEAEKHYRQMLARKPDDASLYANLGNILLQAQDRLEEAVQCYQHALTLKPGMAEIHNNLGYALQTLGQLDDAVQNFRRALELKPELTHAHWNLVNLLKIQGKLEDEIEACRKMLLLKPNEPQIHEQLGYALRAKGDSGKAVEHFRHVRSFMPDSVEAHSNLGHALLDHGDYEGAEECHRRAVFLSPDSSESHCNLGSSLLHLGKLDEAIQCYRHALLLKPDNNDARCNLGHAFQAQGRYGEAIECLRQVLMIQPNHDKVSNNLFFTLSFQRNISSLQYLAEVKNYGAKVLAKAHPYSDWSASLPRSLDQPLRIGVVSGDFKDHPVGFFIENILVHLDQTRITLVAYPTIAKEDALTARIKPFFSSWNSIAGLNDKEAAERIHADKLHILIDLSGHTAHNRLSVFAWKPAPVQVSWLGYFASTGIPGMDYLLADPVSVPEAHRAHFTETVWYLPDTRLCFTAPTSDVDLTPKPLPASSAGYITFGCFQRLTKINDDVLALWGRIFQSLPQARLRLQNNEMKTTVAREELLQRLARVGIDAERVTLEGSIPRKDYLLAHAHVDIIMDTFPYTGGTTTCEALWMGVPTLSLAGDSMVARQGASLLACAGLEEWIAYDEEEYVERAIAHASDLARLAELRLGLRQQVLASPLFDAPRFARNLEHALRAMWEQRMGLEQDGNGG